MAINSYGENIATHGAVGNTTAAVKDKTILGKDDFMKLLLVELQHQDPTEPMDSEKILSQTSQLATLEASENTNKALSDLAASLGASQHFSTIAAIGKTADLGSNAIAHDKGSDSSFEVYFPQEIKNGTLEILNNEGKVVGKIDIDMKDKDGNVLDKKEAGVYQFDWDGTLSDGSSADSGIYYITASYRNEAGDLQTTRLGTYPIEAVRFEEGKALVKVGSNYVPLDNIKEVY
ncbi:MAG: flagellar hook capping protein [Sulfurimonas sp.]|uniref:flagellar hook capping FlgD N-terminal domain-containing protein n=1 Tax=Sulfurimonas sp. TaxID=2022749 RepID=UPI0025E68E3B|nr:flagellar hook capping FlgD N-terminal domain-containing protein [Sulfurimonas sp.]MCK9491579.1 flagellar hook capping protein [Sulfurimonas sp.]